MKKGKYEIRVDQTLTEVDAHEFAVFGYGCLIVHRDFKYPKTWTVSEPRTGMWIVSKLATRKAAMEEAIQSLIAHGEASFNEEIRDGLKLSTNTTRYQKENYVNEEEGQDVGSGLQATTAVG